MRKGEPDTTTAEKAAEDGKDDYVITAVSAQNLLEELSHTVDKLPGEDDADDADDN